MSITNKIKKSKAKYLLVGLLVIGLVFGALSMTYAAETLLHDEAPGTVITFSGKQWTILEQMPNGETYLFLGVRYGDGTRAFDPDGTNMYDPDDSNNIAYYLNNDFYNNLSQKELINEHSWDRVNQGVNQGDVTCKVGLISEAEYRKHFLYYDGKLRSPDYYYWWTRDPYGEIVRAIHPEGNMYRAAANGASLYVHPTLYLKPNIIIDQNKAVVGELIILKPDTPEEFSVSSNSSNEVNLTWQANTEEDLAGYRIYKDDVQVDEIVSTTYADSNVEPGMTYKYAISAYNTEGQESEWTMPIMVTTPPAKPTDLNGDATGRTVYLTWAGSGNPRYIIERSSNGTDYIQVDEVSNKLFEETHDLWGTTYFYRVAQMGQDGSVSEFSEPVQVTIEPVPVPQGLTASVDGNEIILSWQAAEDINTYIVERSTDNEEWEEIARLSTTTHTDAAILPDVEYRYRVRANRGEQTSESSNVVGVTLSPIPPANIQVSVSGKSVTLAWQESVSAIAYIIERSIDGSWVKAAETSELSFQENAPRWDTSYQYRIKAITPTGETEPSEPVQVTIPSVPVPVNIQANAEGNQITINWDEIPGISLYRIQRSKNSIFWNEPEEVEATTYVDSDLDWDQRYYYRIQSVDGDQESTYSSFIMAQTEPELVPIAPQISYSVDNTNVRLVWEYLNVSGYRVYINNELREELPGNASSYNFTGENGETYKVKIEAFNDFGKASSTVTIKVVNFTAPEGMVGDVASNAGAVFGSMGGLLALALAFRGSGPLVEAARRFIGM